MKSDVLEKLLQFGKLNHPVNQSIIHSETSQIESNVKKVSECHEWGFYL